MFQLFRRMFDAHSSGKSYFNSEYYLTSYPDVKNAGVDPYTHFLTHGWREGRNPSPNFHTLFYKDRNHGGRLSENPLQHYVLHKNEADLRIFPESEREMIEIQRQVIGAEFDEMFYSARYSVPVGSALDHYLSIGWRQGCEPNRTFSSSEYMEAHPHVAVLKVAPFYHFVSTRAKAHEPQARTPVRANFASALKKSHSVDKDRAAQIAAISHEFEFEVLSTRQQRCGRRWKPSAASLRGLWLERGARSVAPVLDEILSRRE